MQLLDRDQFTLFAHPWWVNLLLVVPFASWLAWRRKGLVLGWRTLFASAIFAIAFGFVEAAIVVYLGAATGMLRGIEGTLADVRRLSAELYRRPISEVVLPSSLLTVELFREAATMFMLVSVSLLAARTRAERWAIFLWCFAIWDIVYYAGLWATVRWPYSLLAPDVLFLIPVPWIAQVWFPILVSGLCMAAVLTTAIGNRE